MIAPGLPENVELTTVNVGRGTLIVAALAGARSCGGFSTMFGFRKKFCDPDGSPAMPLTTAFQRQ